MIADGHDCICNCNSPFGHLLASIFPPGHQDRDLTINQILQRDYKECHSGGDAETSHGLATIKTDGGVKNIKEEDEDQDIGDAEDLLMAADRRRRRRRYKVRRKSQKLLYSNGNLTQ